MSETSPSYGADIASCGLDVLRERFPRAYASVAAAGGEDGILEATRRLPFRATRFFLSLASDDPADPILRQVLPSADELVRTPSDLDDPLGERTDSTVPHLVRSYRSRALVRACGACPLTCRFCFRRGLDDARRGFVSDAEIDAICGWIETRGDLREILVSGGDPLLASDERLERLLAGLRRAAPNAVLRICTRAPVTAPGRIDRNLVALLSSVRPAALVLHTNHPRELSPEARAAVDALVGSGVPVYAQTVLLRGVNDDETILAELFALALRSGAKPYYLFQGDLTPGTARFRVPLSRGLELYGRLRRELSGLELPRYAVDAPGGGGKAYLPEDIAGRDGADWILKLPNGSIALYPEE